MTDAVKLPPEEKSTYLPLPQAATTAAPPPPLPYRGRSRLTKALVGCLLFYGASRFWTTPSWTVRNTASLPKAELQKIMLETSSGGSAREWSKYYTSGPHLAGKNLSQALWTKQKWEEWGVEDVQIATYEIYTNYPVSHSLSMSNGSDVVFNASLEEDEIDEDPTSKLDDRIPTFHGYSASGNVTGEFVYANYATFDDFAVLESHGVNVTGKIVICKYGAIFRGLKVKRAQELGAIGIIMYSDPGDDGEITEENGYEAYPNGLARHPSSVQRGSVQFLSIAPGDPTTPGYPSLPGAPRVEPETIPKIPSLPISFADALPILKALNGHGLLADDLGDSWKGSGLYYKNVTYNVGPAPNLTLNLVNEVEYEITPQWDVIGVIKGHIPDETVILGNHRDAWIAGGAGDPNSGSATLNEVVRAFGKMLDGGWKPMRSIILASWDGEEYGLLGSTEWVEDKRVYLHGHALAYLNVDVGARTSHFAIKANPLLNDIITTSTKAVIDPLRPNQTIYDTWNKYVANLGSGSDYTAFQDFLGIPSVDMGFSGSDPTGPVYHYHSNYDSFHWMEKFGDPSFDYHAAMAKIWGIMALELVDAPVVPFNATAYATALARYLDGVKDMLNITEHGDHHGDHQGQWSANDERHGHPPLPHHDPDHHHSNSPPHHPPSPPHHPPPPEDPHGPDHPGEPHCPGEPPHHPHHPPSPERFFKTALHHLTHKIHHLIQKAHHFDKHAAHVAHAIDNIDSIPKWKWWKRLALYHEARRINQSYKYFDRSFVYPKGLDGRPIFKHVVYAPGLWTGYAGDTFPGLVESVRDEDWRNGARWAMIIAQSVTNAENLL